MSRDGYGLIAARLPGTALPDWQPELELLKRETQQAKESGRSDSWTLAEAECWVDLVDAEIAAQAHPQMDEGEPLWVLRTWKAELGALVRTLHALEPSAQSGDGVLPPSALPHEHRDDMDCCAATGRLGGWIFM